MILEGKQVLITGGTGTLGRALVKAIISLTWGRPSSITIFSRGEDEQKEMADTFAHPRLRFVPGDVQNLCDVSRALESKAKIVIHCAAMKDVVQCEDHPWSAIRSNIHGSENVARASCWEHFNVERAVLVSSDKAIMPIGIYGCTKQIGERVFIDFAKRAQRPIFSIVRLVNLWGSSGSVVPLFRRQIAAGGPITITDNRMIRWFMWPSDAATFILNTLQDARSGEIAIPPAYAMRITDVATALMMEADKQVEVKIVGTRPGEKLYEAKIADHELPRYVLRKYPLIKAEFDLFRGQEQPLKDAGPQGYMLSPSAIVKMMKEKGA